MKRMRKFMERWRKAVRLCRVLKVEYGWQRSLKAGIPQDKGGNLLPWYTYPAIEFLGGLDFRDKTVFEWGCGYSSLYWARQALRVTSVEDNREWFARMNAMKAANGNLMFAEDQAAYVNMIATSAELYDVIIIDGKHRKQCAEIAPRYLRKGGVIVFDNSDWYPNTRALLRSQGLTEFFFCGFGPLVDFPTATSVFIRAEWSFSYKDLKVVGKVAAVAQEDC